MLFGGVHARPRGSAHAPTRPPAHAPVASQTIWREMRRRLSLLPLLVVAVLAVAGTGRAAAACSPTADSGVVDAANTPTRSEGEESVSLDPANPEWAIVGANEGSQGGGANGANETP